MAIKSKPVVFGKLLADVSGSAQNNKNKSVFDLGYIPTSDANRLPHDKSAYFKTKKDGFWEIIVRRYTEQHAEKFSLHETVSDTVVVHASGACPIQVTLEGHLPAGADLDTRVRFLKKYINSFRDRNFAPGKEELLCIVRYTAFRLQITDIALSDSVETPDYTLVSIKGVASDYRQVTGAPLEYVYNYADAIPAGTMLKTTKPESKPKPKPEVAEDQRLSYYYKTGNWPGIKVMP